MRFARADATPLPGFDENAYVPVAQFDRLPLRDLVARLEGLRRYHLSFFRTLNEEEWSRQGEGNGKAMSVRAIAYTIAGHGRHHTAILQRRLAAAKLSA